MLLIFTLIFFNFNYNKKNNLQELYNLKKEIFNIKQKYLQEINFYKNIFQLYIENRTAFYIRGRQKVMESVGKTYNDSNIVTIQDKYNWLIIHENPEEKTDLVDKILLHNYSIKVLGKDICVPIIKIYNTVDEINLNDLPNKFVMKCNHGSGMNIFCKNKKKFNLSRAKKLLKEWMNVNYGLKHFEFQYINIKKKIFAEKYLCDNILDYKFYCFNGSPKFIRVQKHLKDIVVNNYYNLNWELNEIETNFNNYKRRPDIIFKKPKNFDLMIDYAKKLSSKFAFVRVDLYEVNDIVYLSELTFTTSNVIMPYKDRNQSLYLATYLDLTKIKKS